MVVTNSPTAEPVSLDEAKDHVRPPGDEDDTYIDALIAAARSLCETHTRRAIAVASYRESFGCFPASGVIEISNPPLVSVESVQYVDTDGATQTLSPTQWVADTASEPGRVMRAYGVSWPAIRTSGVAEPVQVNFTAGYVAAPRAIKQAMLLMIGHWYEHREAVSEVRLEETPMAVKSLLAASGWGAYP